MAVHYIREMRTVQPQGPYYQCAFSARGLINFEMARQLHALGEEVAFLGLLDSYCPDYPEYLPTKKRPNYKVLVHLNTFRLHGMQSQAHCLFGRSKHRVTLLGSMLFEDLLMRLDPPMSRRYTQSHHDACAARRGAGPKHR